jgi:predicted O-methyltransferase YrrM
VLEINVTPLVGRKGNAARAVKGAQQWRASAQVQSSVGPPFVDQRSSSRVGERAAGGKCDDGRVDPDRFAAELPRLFDGFPEAAEPRDGRFAEVLEAVPGLATPNTLALINLAAGLRGPGESYVEVGTYRGTSLIAAMLGNEGDFVGIDNFTLGDGSREQLDRNLARFGLDGRATVLEGDAFELVPEGALGDRRVGVWYYDAAHDYEHQLEGLRMVEPYLAPRALLIVDDSEWDEPGRATRDYLAAQPRARLLFDLPGKRGGRPQWHAGMMVVAWQA